MRTRFPGAVFTETVSAAFLLVLCLAAGCVRPVEESVPRIVLAEGVKLPAVSGLAWLGPSDAEGERFVSVTGDGRASVWDVFSGRLLFSSPSGEIAGVLESGGTAPPSFSGTENGTALPVTSPDGTKKLFSSDDGAVLLADAASGKELARYYVFDFSGKTPARSPAGEWISIVPEGFYNASSRGSSFLAAEKGTVRYSLDQLSEALFRPDLFAALLAGEKPGLPAELESLLGEDSAPPRVSVSFAEAREGEAARTLTVKITEQKGGAGRVALYRRSGEREIPAGLFWAEEAPGKKYSENGDTCYEIRINPEPGAAGVSVFNSSNTVESGRFWIDVPDNPAPASYSGAGAPPLPVLRVLLAAGDQEKEQIEELGGYFSREEEGDTYSAVKLINLSTGEWNRAGFTGGLDELCADAAKNDTLIVYVRGAFRAGPLGDLGVVPPGAGLLESELWAEDIVPRLSGSASNCLVILDLESDAPGIGVETALRRFRRKLGPKAVLALAGAPDSAAFIDRILEIFRGGSGSPTKEYISAADFLALAGTAGAGESIRAFPPPDDFRIAGRFANSGELKFQTMASGMLKIDQVDQNPAPLPFGETVFRRLPPGSYISDMIYRNGYRETRTVELRKKDSKWVIFTYTPPLLVGDFSSRLPALGINTAELNPANYQKVNREAMEGMGMAPYYVAYLAGEKLYREGNYDKAVAEYSRAISLKSDYADAYVSRGNARRRKGELDKAIEDYTRALGLKKEYAEVYNYRGFAWARKGDQNRAIADYTQAIRYRAGYVDAYFNRAYAYSEQGSWEKAIADYTEVIKLEPANAVAYNERGKAHAGKGDHSRAASDYAAAEKLKGP